MTGRTRRVNLPVPPSPANGGPRCFSVAWESETGRICGGIRFLFANVQRFAAGVRSGVWTSTHCLRPKGNRSKDPTSSFEPYRDLVLPLNQSHANVTHESGDSDASSERSW